MIQPTKTYRAAFTLIELLVVVAIIATLISILLPSLRMARNSARTVKCLSNVRQWGTGTLMWSDDNRGDLPWDGPSTEKLEEVVKSDGTQAYEIDYFYPNAVPPYVASDRYDDIIETAAAQGRPKDIPLPGSDSLFVCPSAKYPKASDTPPEAPYAITGTPYYFYYNYVINSKLENGSRDSWPLLDEPEKSRLGMIRFPAATVLLFDLRSTNQELIDLGLDPGDYGNNLKRIHGRWDVMSLRHNKGASTLFADGSAHVVDFKYANTKQDYDYMGQMLKVSTRYGPPSGYNQPDLIWTPLGVAK